MEHEVIPSFVPWFHLGIAIQKILLLLQIVLSEIFLLNFMPGYFSEHLWNTNMRLLKVYQYSFVIYIIAD